MVSIMNWILLKARPCVNPLVLKEYQDFLFDSIASLN
jgi:hypothetical protein